MAEKANYRATLAYLREQGYPFTFNKGEAAKMLGLSYDALAKLIKSKKIKVECGIITLGAIANYLCD